VVIWSCEFPAFAGLGRIARRWDCSKHGVSAQEAVLVTHRLRACLETNELIPGTLALSTAPSINLLVKKRSGRSRGKFPQSRSIRAGSPPAPTSSAALAEPSVRPGSDAREPQGFVAFPPTALGGRVSCNAHRVRGAPAAIPVSGMKRGGRVSPSR